MLNITNPNKFPVQLVVRSRKAPQSFTTLIIPGIGAGKNIYPLEDERTTEYIQRAEKMGLVSVKHITNTLREGE